MNTRREFLAGCSMLAAAAVLKPASSLLAPPAFTRLSLGRISLSDFAQHVGTTFRLARAGRSAVRLTLVEARPRPDPGLAPAAAIETGEHRFALLFRGPPAQRLEQSTYTFEHPVLGRLTMFIVPVLPEDGAHSYYEAIFNRCTGPVV